MSFKPVEPEDIDELREFMDDEIPLEVVRMR